MNKLDEKRVLLVFILLAAVSILGVVFNYFSNLVVSNNQNNTEQVKQSDDENIKINGTDYNSLEYKKGVVDDVFKILSVLHFTSLFDIPTSNDKDKFLYNELQESMNDVNKLKNVTYIAQNLQNSKDELTSTTGLVLNTTLTSLINSNNLWIAYLRGVDIDTVNVSEFQHQLAKFNSSAHDAYLKLAEGMSLFPMIVINFSNENGDENTIDVSLRDYFLNKIESNFSEAFTADDEFYKETKTRQAVVVIVRNYKEYLTSKK
jgi:hypothetical protein